MNVERRCFLMGLGAAALEKIHATPWLSLELFNASYQKSTPEWTLQTGLSKTRRVLA